MAVAAEILRVGEYDRILVTRSISYGSLVFNVYVKKRVLYAMGLV